MISPCRYLAGTGFALSGMNPGPQKLKGRGILTSGMLVSLDAFEEAGGFNAAVRLDFADFEFNRRLCRTVEQFVLLDLTCRHHFFDAENQDVEQAIQRFRFYCQGARASIATRGEVLPRFLVVLAHCLRLSLRFRSVRFLRDFGGYFIRGAEV
jgi:GT2 family glycosyltransferase